MKIKQSLTLKLDEQEIELILSIFEAIKSQSIGFNQLKLKDKETEFINNYLKVFNTEPQPQHNSVQVVSDIPYNPIGNLTDLE